MIKPDPHLDYLLLCMDLDERVPSIQHIYRSPRRVGIFAGERRDDSEPLLADGPPVNDRMEVSP